MMTRKSILSLLALLLPGWAATAAEQDYAAALQRMVAAIQNMAQAVERGGRPLDPRVLDAMRQVPRHELVPEEARAGAYENRPLPIGHGQTISQPFIVALMTDLLRPQRDDVVLEVGTGSGYQAAVLAHLVDRVYTIEIVEPLARRAAADLQALGYANVTVRAGDGYAGWPEAAPFDGILVTAGAPRIPPALVDQLKPGGRMVIPVGADPRNAELTLVQKDRDGKVSVRSVLPVSFVPLTGAGAGGR